VTEGPDPGTPVGLYVHIPFCVSLCPYCDFVVIAGAAARGPRNKLARFLDALRAEIRLRAAGRRVELETLYLGGGTPSLLTSDDLARLIELADQTFGLANGAEITLEANPGPGERGDPRAHAAAGITRVSFGAQSLEDDELRRLGRRHRAADVGEAVKAARSAGIGSINLDLLYDVPGQSLASWMATLEAALALEPDHLSLYALTLDDPDAEGLTGPQGDHLPTTRGARRWRDRARTEQDEDQAAAMYHHATVRLAETGYRGYEISNWARPGHESRHNLAYWERRPVEAVGPGAHAFDGWERRWNAARLDAYLAALVPPDGSPGRLPPGGSEAIDASTAASEQAILGLRTERGLALAAGFEPPLAEQLGWALATELVEVVRADDGERIRLTTRGRLLSNELFARLV
jgi:oxygen-independent coproporphyrinogen-3 oxidase